MKYILVLLIAFFIINLAYTQGRAIKITHQQSNDVIIIEHNKRVRVKTVYGKKISGKLRILDPDNLTVRNRPIKLEHIEKIKRNPLVLSLPVSFVMLYFGIPTTFIGVAFILTGAFDGLAIEIVVGAIATVIGGGLTYGGIKYPNFLEGYSKYKGWVYDVVEY